MNEDLNKLYTDGLNTLPLDIRQAISATPWEETLRKISSDHLLDDDKTDSLLSEVMVIILGYESPEQFNDNLVNNVGLDIATAENMANEITEKILLPIDEKVKELENSSVTNPESDKKTEEEPVASEKPQLTNIPNYSDYDSGKDPYREPIE